MVPGVLYPFVITERIKELEEAKAKLALLEREIASSRNAELLRLPSHYGFSDMKAFIKALKATGGKNGGKGSKENSTKKKRRRATITDETRAEVKKMVAADKTGKDIATALGISVPSVQNIKKELGLIQKRKKKSA